MTAVAVRPSLRHTCNGRHGGSGRRAVIDEVAIMAPETAPPLTPAALAAAATAAL